MYIFNAICKDESGRNIALLRSAFGLIIFWRILELCKFHKFLFSEEGWLPAMLNSAHRGSYTWSIFDFITDSLSMQFFFILSLIFSAMMALGFLTRLSTLIVFILFNSLINRNIFIIDGADSVIMAVVFFLCFSSCGRFYSIDNLLKSPLTMSQNGPSPIQSVILIRIQVMVIYLSAGLEKLKGQLWIKGQALHYVLQDPIMSRLPSVFSYGSKSLEFIGVLLSRGTLIFEIFFPIFILWPRTRLLIILAGIFFHIGIFCFLDVGLFSFVMIATYLVFIPDELLAKAENFIFNNFFQRSLSNFF